MFEQSPIPDRHVSSADTASFSDGDRLDLQRSILDTVEIGLARAGLVSATHEKEIEDVRHKIIGQYSLDLTTYRRLEATGESRSEYDLAA